MTGFGATRPHGGNTDVAENAALAVINEDSSSNRCSSLDQPNVKKCGKFNAGAGFGVCDP